MIELEIDSLRSEKAPNFETLAHFYSDMIRNDYQYTLVKSISGLFWSYFFLFYFILKVSIDKIGEMQNRMGALEVKWPSHANWRPRILPCQSMAKREKRCKLFGHLQKICDFGNLNIKVS